MTWLEHLTQLASNKTPFVIVTVASVRGHTPRDAGAKMLVTATQLMGSVGGGNLEQVAINKARTLLASRQTTELFTLTLNPKAGEHGVQCCGGEVTLLLEKVNPFVPTIAIFGAGHVGKAVARVLGSLPVTVQLVDSRPAQLGGLTPAANVQLVHAPVPETALAPLPAGAHLLLMTHDHAEDIAILDMALRRNDFGFIGLIGSSAKWAHFQQLLKHQGHTNEALAHVTTPIGLPGIKHKQPEVIAISVAAQLLRYLELSET